MKRAFIFDFDGTLIYTGAEMQWYGNEGLKKIGLPTVAVEYYTNYSGKSHEEFFKGILKDCFGETVMKEKWLDFLNAYMEKVDKDPYGKTLAYPYPHITEVLRALKRKGYLLAVFSNNNQGICESVVREHFGDIFDLIQGWDGIYQPKPSREGADKILNKLNLKPEECYYIGDSQIDMQTAQNVGFTKIAALWGYRKKEDFLPYHPDYLMENPTDLLWVEAKNSLCNLCPRACNKERNEKSQGVCHALRNTVKVSRSALHFWEEPVISGERGSGTVFFSGCSLHCRYCQNYRISGGEVGKEISVKELAGLFLDLQAQGAHNINLVTPDQYALEIIEAIRIAKEQGLGLPVIFNGSGYETEEMILMMSPYIDIWLTDFKYGDCELAGQLSYAEDYPEIALKALAKMKEVTPENIYDENGMLIKGIIVRNLILPGEVKNSEKVLSMVFGQFGNSVIYSLMNQYTPVRKFTDFSNLNRKVTGREYEKLLSFALDLGIENAFIQEGETQKESYIPDFDLTGLK